MAEKTKSTATTDEANVYSAFSNIQLFARDLNTQLPTPEVVFIGKQGHGKSALIESIIGQPFNIVAKEGSAATKRPIYFTLINNPSCAEPKVTLKRDTVVKDATADKVVTVETLEAELATRNVISPTPIYITYEYKNCWNLTFIDTPGIVSSSDKNAHGEVSADEVEEMVFELAKPAHRAIVCVEEIKDGTSSEMVPIVKKIDPKFDRTLFVINKFSDQLRNFTSTRDLNRYLSAVASSESQVFFTSLVPSKDRSKYIGQKDKFKKKLSELEDEDLQLLEQLQYDRRFSHSVGVKYLRQQILDLSWRKYQDGVPELLKRLRQYKKNAEVKVGGIQSQLKSLESNTLRGNAARYAMHFLQAIEKLLTGTLEGNPSINGQSLEEEKAQDDTGDWRDSDFQPIRFDSVEWKIPHANSKLYGGQQFERLLAEFKAVVEHQNISNLSMDDIATATGPQKLNNASNITWAASDIAQKQIQKTLMPLLDQLFRRSTYLMKRLVFVVDNMLENAKKTRAKTGRAATPDQRFVEEFDEYPFFKHAVKDLYYKYVDEIAESCKKKCKDEFFSTRLIYWELTNLDSKSVSGKFKLDNVEEIKKTVVKLATETYDKLRDRIAKNILLKSYNYFLVPMQTDIWSEIQGSITCLSDEQLQELFEVPATVAKLQATEKEMQDVLTTFVTKESNFLKFTTSFAKCNPKELQFL